MRISFLFCPVGIFVVRVCFLFYPPPSLPSGGVECCGSICLRDGQKGKEELFFSAYSSNLSHERGEITHPHGRTRAAGTAAQVRFVCDAVQGVTPIDQSMYPRVLV